MAEVILVHRNDDVCVAVRSLPAGTTVDVAGLRLTLLDDVPAGHKIALRQINSGEEVTKYGHLVGRASNTIEPGRWVHSHNIETTLADHLEYTYEPTRAVSGERRSGRGGERAAFHGYRRQDGRVGTRNEIWVINTVGCVNRSAQRIARVCNERFSGIIDGVHAFAHPFGCSQLGDDLSYTQRILAGLVRHPNAGGVLVIGLGCENNQIDALLEQAGVNDERRIRTFNSQEVLDEVETGIQHVEALVEVVCGDERTECHACELVLGLKCGGSDVFSGLSANPLVGRVADRLSDLGGTCILTEVPEMFGAEQQLMNRAADRATFDRVVSMINDFKQYFLSHGQPVYENPSPGNRDGGLTTLEEKSLGAVQKGGLAPVKEVVGYGATASPRLGGLSLLYAPGNDGVSVTAEVAGGATLVLFTTGRGTPLGFPVPTLKISSNNEIAEKNPHWIDFSAGDILEGTVSVDELEARLFEMILRVASGEERAKNELNDYREIAIWKEGVTL